MQPALPIRAFDKADDYGIVERSGLPHWSQAGTVCFITWRTWDSLPRPVLHDWLKRRNAWLRDHNIDPLEPGWRQQIADLPPNAREEMRSILAERWESQLDACHGACVMRRPELAAIVAASLLHFDEQRFVVTDFIVMPNHVHLLAAFPTEEAMLAQCDSWKHFTATRLNRALQRTGRFWEEDQFDHLVRSADAFEHYRGYIADNPVRANLRAGEFTHFTKDLSRREC
jgi:REP element-mobilizing transposase RayT